MSDLKLNSILLRNWVKFGSAHIQFPDQGLVMVTGSNVASGGKLLSVGCHAHGQKILMYSGRLKPVEEIRELDRLMGPDSKPRTVLKLCRGRGKMYRIVPVKGKPFIVNEDHILALEFTRSPNYPMFSGDKVEMSVRDFIGQPTAWQKECKLYRCGVTWRKAQPHWPVPPRILGLWLGDGTSSAPHLTTADRSIAKEWTSYGLSLGLHARKDRQPGNASITICLSTSKGGNHRKNVLLEKLRHLGVYKNKHIPKRYLIGSRVDRLSLLSGLIDSDGTLSKNWFSYTTSNAKLAEGVEFLANSLGFFTTAKPIKKKCQTGAVCAAFLVSIIGDGSYIPTRCPNKRAAPRRQKKRHNVTGFKIEPCGHGDDDYYGFATDRDGLYLLDDFTVTHNSGKTSFGESIGRAIFGVGSRQSNLKECSSDEKGDTYVKVTATLLGKPLVIEMGYKCAEMSKSGEALRFSYDGAAPVERGLIQQTREELAKLIGVSPLLAEWTVFVDGDALKFNRLSQSDQVELVMAAMKQPPWNDFYERAHKSVGNFKKAIAKEMGNLEQLQQQVVNAEQDTYTAQSAWDAAKAEYGRQRDNADKLIAQQQEQIKAKLDAIEAAQARQQAIAKEIEVVIEAKAAAHHTLEIEVNKTRDVLRQLQSQRTPLLETWQKARSVSALKTEAHRVLASVPKVCPTCRKPWDNKVDPQDLAARRAEMEAAAGIEQAAQGTYNGNEQKIVDYSDQLEDLNRKITSLNAKHSVVALSNEHEGLTRTMNRHVQDSHQIELQIQKLQAGVSDAAVKQAEATYAERWRVVEKTKAALDEASKSLAESNSALKIMEYWSLAFSPAGIPNMVLQDAIAPLNHESRRVSAMMTGNTIDVRFNTRRALVSGEQKPELVVEVDNRLGSKKIKLNSKGEGGLTNFIIAETLSNVGQVSRRVAFRWYDEVVPHQDPVVCKSIYSYMREIAHKLGVLIFIVDHNPTAANYADYFLQIEKKGDKDACDAVAKWV